jgi:hypothetical protein
MRKIKSAESATLMTIEPRHPKRLEKKKNNYRSPLSPCPDFTFVLAFLRRSALSDLPTSSDSLNFPPVPRLTYRLSVPVSISSRFAAFFLPPAFFFTAAFLAMSPPAEAVQLGCPPAHRLLGVPVMDIKETNPNANIPQQQPDAPLGDRGNEKTWEPPKGEQGISNREGDEDSDDEREPKRA